MSNKEDTLVAPPARKMDCDVVADLMPMYIERSLNTKSRRLVTEHLRSCESCKSLYEELKKPDPEGAQGTGAGGRPKKTAKDRTVTIAALAALAGVAVIILIQGVFFLQDGHELEYNLVCFYLLFPLAALVCSCITGLRTTYVKWLLPPVSAMAGWLLPIAVLHASDMIAVLFAAVSSVVGLLFGVAYRRSIILGQ